jgi:predicted ATPase/DNA-binding SARP family transcriptional activator
MLLPATGAVGLELRILGPVCAVRAGRDLALGGPKQRGVLALLLVDAGRAVPAEYLVEALWRGSAPPGAAGTLRSYVSRLRTLLGPEATVSAQGGGYAITVQPGQVDASRFERLVAAGKDALGAGEVGVAAARFREALALWRGRALADVADVESLALEGARLEELRLVAVEGRAEADIELGLHAEVTGELERLVAEHPVRERLWRLLVLALYRGERQADALAAYRRARAMLAEELGLEPGEELRRLEQAVLRQEVAAAAPRRERHNLPLQLTSFLGRDLELAALDGLLQRARLVTLTGPGGAGKTRLALEFAAEHLERFPDGVWLADLAGLTDPGLVPSLVMGALGVRQTGDIPVMEALRYRLRSAQLLLVLDNCEHLLGACADLAGELLRNSPGLRVLATSRERLGVAGEAAYPVRPLVVPPEPAGEDTVAGAPAVRLFLDRGSAARAGDGVAAPVAVVARICRELDGLPLAIELAAARTSVLSVEEIEAHLADKFRFLAYRRPVASPRHQALKAAIGWSYELLPEQERAVFRAVSVFAGGFGLGPAAAVCCDGDEAAALDMIDSLAAKSLLVAEPAPGQTRYRLLETIRQYAFGQLAEAGEAAQARLRHAEAFLSLAERESDLGVLSREHDNFRAALEHALAGGDETGPRLARALSGFWLARGFFQEARGWLERALAAGSPDPLLRADLLRLLGTVLFEAGDLDRAEGVLGDGAQAAAAAGLAAAQARISVLLADVHVLRGGPGTGALAGCVAAAALLASEGDQAGLAEAWLLIGKLRVFLGDVQAGIEALEDAVRYARQSGNHRTGVEARGWLVVAFRALPVPAGAAIGRAEQFLQTVSGDPWAEAMITQPLSVLYALAGRFADARAAIARSRSLYAAAGAAFGRDGGAVLAGEIELIAGDAAAAERKLAEGCQALRAMGERAYLSGALALLAEALYAQERLDEAERLTDEARAVAAADDIDTQARWRATRAKLLARRGQLAAAGQLAGEAVAAVSGTSSGTLLAGVLVARAEVSRLAGAPAQAEASLREALRIYEEGQATPLADRTRAALASLAPLPPTSPR